MKITQKNVDDLTMIVTLNIEKEDYSGKKQEILKKFRRDADIKGFRKGMAPMSIIEKMHGRSAMLDAVNNVISEGLNNHITENKLNIIGEPLPNETEQKPIDWENDQEFSVSFDLAVAPKVEINLTSDDKIPFYEVKVSKKEKEEYVSNLRKQYGTLEDVETVEDDDFIIADLVQQDNSVEGTYIALRSVADKQAKDLFIGKKSGDSFEIDVNKAFENETDRAAMLKVKKEELSSLNPVYTVVVKEVKRFKDAQENQDFYDKVFGPGNVSSSEEFAKMIDERMKSEHENESDYRFMLDARDALIEKAAIALPEEFLKRWLFTANEGKFTMEEIEKDFELFLKDFRWQLIRQYITKEQKLSVTRENLLDHARKIAGYQFAMYGLNNAGQEQIDKYAESLLANEKEGRRIYEKVEEDLVLDYVRSVVSLDKKGVSIEKLRELTN
ncbi:MAG: trigger factor [Bacteroidales bacterium]|nr:trigger factor [Bacteroidales bacterium]MDD3299881.1 trigger factor [Bacteroidales bacterium]MDD3843213.1 trigger factor [Bacteroidales bacterium]MDD4618070.1 trigger factor [Bacteroidales bacterium]